MYHRTSGNLYVCDTFLDPSGLLLIMKVTNADATGTEKKNVGASSTTKWRDPCTFKLVLVLLALFDGWGIPNKAKRSMETTRA